MMFFVFVPLEVLIVSTRLHALQTTREHDTQTPLCSCDLDLHPMTLT